MIYITSDLHLGHDRDFIYGPRGFGSVDEMNEALVRNWNSVVSEEDTVYVLGDIMLGEPEIGVRFWKMLKGTKIIVIGNHDSHLRIEMLSACDNTQVIGYAKLVKYKGYNLFMSHYPTLTRNYDEDKPLKEKVINLCGHSHTKDRFADMGIGNIYHCELDAHDNMPVSLDLILKEIEEYFGSKEG